MNCKRWNERTVVSLLSSFLLLCSGTAIADIGAVQWQKILNVDDGAWDLSSFYSVGFRNDGSIMAVGTGDGAFVVRYNEGTGDTLDTPAEWIDYESGTNFNYFYDHVVDNNGNIYTAGRHDTFDPGVWKYNSSAVLQTGWPKVHAVTGDGLHSGVALDSSGFVYAVGYNNSDWHISKHAISDGTVPAGFPLSYNPNGFLDRANKVATDSDDNFIVVGFVGVGESTYDWYVRKYASDGSLLWDTSYDLKGNNEGAMDVEVDSMDNIIVCGYRNNGTDESAGMDRDWYIVKYAKDGDGSGGAQVLWEQSWNGGNGAASRVARALVIDSRNNVYVGGEQNDSVTNAARSYIQYRDGQTGILLKSQELNHPVTVNGEAGTAGIENDYIGGLALDDEQLVIAGYVWEGYKDYGRTAWITMIKILPELGSEAWSSRYYSATSSYSANFLDVGFLSDGKILATGNKPWVQGGAVRYNSDTGTVEDSPAEWLSESNGSGIQFRGQAIDSSGNIYFAGIETSTMKVWKYTSSGVFSWEASGPAASINSYNVAVDSSGNSYSTGVKDNAVSGVSGQDGILNKFDANGSPVAAPFPIAYDHDGLSDGFFGVTVDSSDNVIVSGWVQVDATVDHNDGLIQKYNSSGTLLWQQQYDGIGLSDNLRRVIVDGDDNIIIVGYSNRGSNESTDIDWDWLIIKYDSDGVLLWQQTWDDGTQSTGYARDLVIDEQNNLYITGEQADKNGMTRIHIQYRDGQTGALLKMQQLSHIQTYHDNPTTENVKESSIGLKDGKLVVAAYVDDTSNPSTYDAAGVIITLDRTFVVTPSATANGSIDPTGKVEDVVYDTTVAFTLTPDAQYAPASITGTCLAGAAPTDNGDGTWLYTTGAVTSDCTVEVNFTLAFEGGDINRDHSVDLVDAIIGLQILVGIEPSVPVYLSADFNDDMQIGMIEVISIFRKMVSLPFLSYDCNGDRDGTAYIDACSTCVEGNTGQTACATDCNGDLNGTAVEDDCGVCDDNPANDNTTCVEDCAGTLGGAATTDGCGVCDDDETNNNTTCTEDCNGDWGGTATTDNCGDCVGGNTGETPCPAYVVDSVYSMITANWTGLRWQKADDGVKRTWSGAQSYCDSLELGGSSNWRMPTKDELNGLVVCTNGHPVPLNESQNCMDDGYSSYFDIPTIDSSFTSQSSWYWTSSSYPWPNSVWMVGFQYGGPSQESDKNWPHYIRCVEQF